MSTLGYNIKNLRAQNHMSQAKFAELMNTSQQRVSEWECDRIEPSFYNIIRIIRVFGITFEDLIDGIVV